MDAAQMSALPPLYAGWMDEFLGAPIPGEAPSTCSDCAMCAPPGVPTDATLLYNPATKCCTYLPRMWNFLAGRVLADHSPESAAGRATLELRLDAGVAVTPMGLEQTPIFTLHYAQARHHFGRVGTLRCPHYLPESGGLCGVWRHRESTCATWFCKHERGAVGERFFNQLHRLLVTAEMALARWAVLELDIGAEALGLIFPLPTPQPTAMTPEDFDGRVDRLLYRRRWGHWAGREREFFAAAERLVGGLRWAEVRRIAGPELQAHERLVKEAHGRLLSDVLPERLRAEPIKMEQQGPDMSRVGTYSHVDPLSVPNELIGVLHYFDGRTTTEAILAIEDEARLRLEPGLVQRLADFGILKEVEGG